MAIRRSPMRLFAVVGTLVLLLVALTPATRAGASNSSDTYIVLYQSAPAVNRAALESGGHAVSADLGAAGIMIVRSTNQSALQALPGVIAVVRDRIRYHVPDEQATPVIKTASSVAASGCASTTQACPLQWDEARIHVPQAWRVTQGSPSVKVAVLDTGLTSTHEEVGPNYDRAQSKSFVQPSAQCPADAATFNSVEDYSGHGTWTNTHVAGINGSLMTGIAPKTTLINVRVLGACGFGYDTWILQGMMYANMVGARIESMSLGGYMCGHGVVAGSHYCSDPGQVGNDPIVWLVYQRVVSYLLAHGTIVVAAAGNEHVQLDTTGQVVSHGSLAYSSPMSDTANDLYGTTESPGGVPGAIAVAAVNRVTAPAATGETKFGQYGVGLHDQLTYYSSYGQRIDVSAPGGARNYNVPRFDCLVPNCARLDPSAPGATDNPGDFGAWGVDSAGNPCSTCYQNVQGTSMATPQVAGVAALALAVKPTLTPAQLSAIVRFGVSRFVDANATPRIATDPALPQYNYDVDYSGPGIPNAQMGHGVTDAAIAVLLARLTH